MTFWFFKKILGTNMGIFILITYDIFCIFCIKIKHICTPLRIWNLITLAFYIFYLFISLHSIYYQTFMKISFKNCFHVIVSVIKYSQKVLGLKMWLSSLNKTNCTYN